MTEWFDYVCFYCSKSFSLPSIEVSRKPACQKCYKELKEIIESDRKQEKFEDIERFKNEMGIV